LECNCAMCGVAKPAWKRGKLAIWEGRRTLVLAGEVQKSQRKGGREKKRRTIPKQKFRIKKSMVGRRKGCSKLTRENGEKKKGTKKSNAYGGARGAPGQQKDAQTNLHSVGQTAELPVEAVYIGGIQREWQKLRRKERKKKKGTRIRRRGKGTCVERTS